MTNPFVVVGVILLLTAGLLAVRYDLAGGTDPSGPYVGWRVRLWYWLLLGVWGGFGVPMFVFLGAWGDPTYLLFPDIEWGGDFLFTLASSLLMWSPLLLAPWGVKFVSEEEQQAVEPRRFLPVYFALILMLVLGPILLLF
ncbi:MAG TPA: hypothetical protein VGD10_08370 [Allosphingosinicella sp.]|uniref:hypothetical protein n=1 Tax=Allosphingosinicella sp. TaxID=2823234 RepID=UPI002ED82258